jgi:hypothetical protein
MILMMISSKYCSPFLDQPRQPSLIIGRNHGVILAAVNNPLFRIFRRSEACRALARVPSIVRGAVRAKTWSEFGAPIASVTGANGPSLSDNPLSAYFNSVKQGRGIWKWTHYFDIYHRHLCQFIGKDVHVVEVGIYSGGSLDMWKAYFGSRCKIYGVDIEPACKVYEDERTRIFIGDQGDHNFWRDFRKQVPKVDVLIDDGGHHPEQQIVTLEEVLPHIRLGGVYMCEDVHSDYNRFAAYVCGLEQTLNAFAKREDTVIPSSFQKVIASIHHYPFMTVIEKATREVVQFTAPKHGSEWQPFL